MWLLVLFISDYIYPGWNGLEYALQIRINVISMNTQDLALLRKTAKFALHHLYMTCILAFVRWLYVLFWYN